MLTRFIPEVVLRQLLVSVQSDLAQRMTLGDLSGTRRTPLPKSPDDILKVLMMRIYAAAHRLETICSIVNHKDVFPLLNSFSLAETRLVSSQAQVFPLELCNWRYRH